MCSMRCRQCPHVGHCASGEGSAEAQRAEQSSPLPQLGASSQVSLQIRCRCRIRAALYEVDKQLHLCQTLSLLLRCFGVVIRATLLVTVYLNIQQTCHVHVHLMNISLFKSSTVKTNINHFDWCIFTPVFTGYTARQLVLQHIKKKYFPFCFLLIIKTIKNLICISFEMIAVRLQ